MKKYEFTDETKIINGTVLRRIRAVRDIPEYGVRVGLIGGFLQSERNLSHDCPAWGGRSTSSPTWGARASSAGKSGQGARLIVECWNAGSSTCSPQTRTSTPTPC